MSHSSLTDTYNAHFLWSQHISERRSACHQCANLLTHITYSSKTFRLITHTVNSKKVDSSCLTTGSYEHRYIIFSGHALCYCDRTDAWPHTALLQQHRCTARHCSSGRLNISCFWIVYCYRQNKVWSQPHSTSRLRIHILVWQKLRTVFWDVTLCIVLSPGAT